MPEDPLGNSEAAFIDEYMQHHWGGITFDPSKAAQYLHFNMFRDPEDDVPGDTDGLAEGASENVHIFTSDTSLFHAMNNSLAVFKSGPIDCLCLPTGCVASRVSEANPGNISVHTDCGFNSSGLPIIVLTPLDGTSPDVKIPIMCTANWTPQIKRGHLRMTPVGPLKIPTIIAKTYVAQSPCNPSGGTSTSIADVAKHVINIHSINEAFCIGDFVPVDFYDHAGHTIPSGNYSVYYGWQQAIALLDGDEPQCTDGALETFIVRFNTSGNASFKDIVGGVRLRGHRGNGDIIEVVCTSEETTGALHVDMAQSGIFTVLDHDVITIADGCTRAHTKWAYDPYITDGSSFPNGVGVGAGASNTCGPAASINGSTFTGTVQANHTFDSLPDKCIPRTTEFEFSDSSSFSIGMTHNGITLGATGTVTCYRTCGNGNMYLSVEGTASGIIHGSDVTDFGCIGPIKAPFDAHTPPVWTDWVDTISISLPISTRRFIVQMRGLGVADANTSVGGVVTYGVGVSVEARLIVRF